MSRRYATRYISVHLRVGAVHMPSQCKLSSVSSQAPRSQAVRPQTCSGAQGAGNEWRRLDGKRLRPGDPLTADMRLRHGLFLDLKQRLAGLPVQDEQEAHLCRLHHARNDSSVELQLDQCRLGGKIEIPQVARHCLVLIASKVVSRESLRRLICRVDLLYSICMTKERFFFSLRLIEDQKFEVRKKVVLQYIEGKSVAQIKSCVPFSIRTIYRWISRFFLGGLENLQDPQERDDRAKGQIGTWLGSASSS